MSLAIDHVFMLPLINGGGGTAGSVHGKSYYYATIQTIYTLVIFSGVRTTIQAYGFIHLKASKDPIEDV